MCGISGSITRSYIKQENINSALKLLGKRGPDSSDYVRRRTKSGWHINLLHTRLSIIDLDKRSKQPMCSKNSDLIFNGEIYNFKEIKKSLEKKREWQTSSDTEVLLALLEERGIEGINKCEGMWAFAWFSKDKEQLILSRDRFGEKPLYIFRDKEMGIFFGSEPKAIFALAGKNLEINEKQISRFLVNGYKSLYKNRDTFFIGLEEISSGHIGIWDSTYGFKEYPWWIPNLDSVDNEMSFEEAVAGTKEKLRESLKIRLRSDVPIAFFLSGGVDSNALISIAKKEFDQDIHSFSIINDDERYEEKEMIDYSIKKLKLKSTCIPIKKENFIRNMQEITKYHDAPVFTLTSYAQWQLMKEVSDCGYKVTISGIAADEIFSGYYDHHNAYLEHLYSLDKNLYEIALKDWYKGAGQFVRNPFLKNPEYFINNTFARDHIYLENMKIAKFLKNNFNEIFQESFYNKNLLKNRMANELFHEIVPVLLHEEDLNAMQNSIENRSPYLDNKLFEWSQKIPNKFLIKNGLAKAVLRESVNNKDIEKIIKSKRKVGFNIPIDKYINFNDTKIKEYCLNQESKITKIVDTKKLKPLLESKNNRSNAESKFLFNFISSKIFLDNF